MKSQSLLEGNEKPNSINYFKHGSKRFNELYGESADFPTNRDYAFGFFIQGYEKALNAVSPPPPSSILPEGDGWRQELANHFKYESFDDMDTAERSIAEWMEKHFKK